MKIATDYHGFLPYQSLAIFKDIAWASFDPRNKAACGFFALHHAMVFLGQGSRFQWLRELHPGFWTKVNGGTYTEDLVGLAKRVHLRPTVHSSWLEIAPIRRALDKALNAGHPVIVGSEPNIHWICIGGRTSDGGYVWADSAWDPVVGGNWSWEELEQWMLYSTNPKRKSYPDLADNLEIIEIAPGRQMPSSRSMVPWIDGIWESLASDQAYAKDWSNLLADMLDVFWDAEYAPNSLSAGGFLDGHLDGIIDAAAFQTGISQAALRGVAHGYRDAAEFHNLVVPQGQEATAIAGFTLKLVAKAQ
jgi:hypothetical protein